jgi:hypothetical protein
MQVRFYILTLTLLLTHQIDAAYWKEWEMFFLPGGIQFFDIFNLLVFPPLLYGIKPIVLKEKKSHYYSLTLGFLGLITLAIHSGFYIAGFEQFDLPVSTGIILATGVCSIGLIRVALLEKVE